MLTERQKLAALKAMTDEQDEDVLSTYLSIAGNKVLQKAFPFNPEQTEVPERYEYTQLEIAVFLLNKRGAEGETTHSENGISRTYSGGDVPPALLREITPMAAVIGGK